MRPNKVDALLQTEKTEDVPAPDFLLDDDTAPAHEIAPPTLIENNSYFESSNFEEIVGLPTLQPLFMHNAPEMADVPRQLQGEALFELQHEALDHIPSGPLIEALESGHVPVQSSLATIAVPKNIQA